MRKDIVDFLEQEIKRRCASPSNFFGIGCYYHIRAVVDNAKRLAKEYSADEEIVIIAGWLHDIASITSIELYEQHHIYGAEISKRILSSFEYEEVKIEKVCQCILNHRGSIQRERLSIEEQCVADADALSHFFDVPGLMYLAYVKKKMDIDEGRCFVRNKLMRSYAKLSEPTKLLYEDMCKHVLDIFGDYRR